MLSEARDYFFAASFALSAASFAAIAALSAASFVASKSLGILLLHHHNKRGARVEVIDTGASYRFLPLMRK